MSSSSPSSERTPAEQKAVDNALFAQGQRLGAKLESSGAGCFGQLSRFATPLLIIGAVVTTHVIDQWSASTPVKPAEAIALEPSYHAAPNDLVQVIAKTDGAQVRWVVHHGNVHQFGGTLADPKEAWFSSSVPGQYKISAITAVSQKVWYKPWTWLASPVPSNRAETVLTVGDAPPPDPGPGPGPTPPGPTPSPAPIPAPGLRVLMVYDNDPIAFNKMTKEQQTIITSGPLRDYLNGVCKGNWHVWPKSVDTTNADPLFKAAMARPRASLPWVVISNGTIGFEGVWPADATGMQALIQKYAPTSSRVAEMPEPRQRLPTFRLLPSHEIPFALGV